MNKIAFLLAALILLVACSKSGTNNELNVVIEVDKELPVFQFDSLQCFPNVSKKWFSNSWIEDSQGTKFNHTRAFLYENQLEVRIGGCGDLYLPYITINIVDSSFYIIHTQTSDVGNTVYYPIYQSLSLNKFPFQLGDTISGQLKFKGLFSRDNWIANSSLSGGFSCVVVGDTTREYTSILEALPAAEFAYKLNAVGLDNIEKLPLLKKLKYFEIIDNSRAWEFPRQILELPKLETLILDCNISHLPEEISKLKNLRSIELWGNKVLKDLPASLKDCKSLETLDFRQNEHIDYTNLRGLSNLKQLLLWETNMVELPEGVLHMTNLEVIGLRSNENLNLVSAIKKLSSLKKVQEVDFSNCNVTKALQSFETLKHIQILNLKDNPLPLCELEKIRKMLPNTTVLFDTEE